MRLFKFLWNDLKYTLMNEQGFLEELLMAMVQSMVRNAQKTSKGGESDATINPLDLLGGGKESKSNMGVLKPEGIDKATSGVDTVGGIVPKLNKVGQGGMPESIIKPTQQQSPIEQVITQNTGTRIPQRYQFGEPGQLNPAGDVIGQTDVNTQAAGFGVQEPPASVPQEYLGFGKGLTHGVWGQPRTEEEQKMRTPWTYYAGKTLGNIPRTALRQQSVGEVERQEQILESAEAKKFPPELKDKLTLLPLMTEKEKRQAYDELSGQYPEHSAALKRILLPNAFSF